MTCLSHSWSKELRCLDSWSTGLFRKMGRGLPGAPVAKPLHSQCRGMRSPHAAAKSSHVAIKTCCSQINKKMERTEKERVQIKKRKTGNEKMEKRERLAERRKHKSRSF